MSKELFVILNRKDSGFGISLLGQPGLPPIIYNILENSSAEESGQVEVGDVILKINETDVYRFTTKEVLKCLRLSGNSVTLKINRDPKLRESVQEHRLFGLSDETSESGFSYFSFPNQNTRDIASIYQDTKFNVSTKNGSNAEKLRAEQSVLPTILHCKDKLKWKAVATSNVKSKIQTEICETLPKFEAYMMTGEHILNITRIPTFTPQLCSQQDRQDNSSNYPETHLGYEKYQMISSTVPNNKEDYAKNNKGVINASNNSAVTRNNWITSETSDATPILVTNKYFDLDTQLFDSKASFSGTFVRSSRSDDRLPNDEKFGQSQSNYMDDGDITSSLNTLCDTKIEQSNSEKIVWTYNASMPQYSHEKNIQMFSSDSSNSTTNTVSPTPSLPSPAVSSTSISSSIMSNQSGSRNYNNASKSLNGCGSYAAGDFSVSEAISNISSPDYKDENSLCFRDVMEISDHSDSDSTLLLSEPNNRQKQKINNSLANIWTNLGRNDVMSCDIQCDTNCVYGKPSKCDKFVCEISTEFEEKQATKIDFGTDSIKSPSPQPSEDGSDVESLHSFHYSPKAVDLPSAIRLAKRLYALDGFKKSDVSRHLSKNNEFSRTVAEEYLKYFSFKNNTLDVALRIFLKQFSLTGETQERERVLIYFSKRYLDCNPGSFNSQDAVHTLTCAIMLLNTDLNGGNLNRKMLCNEFIDNLIGLNESKNFPKEILKHLYYSIKESPLEWALDAEDNEENNIQKDKYRNQMYIDGNPFLDVPSISTTVEYKNGYVMRKCCFESNGKRTPFHKRSWKMFYCTLRDLVLYLHKDENSFRKSQMADNFNNIIRIHHGIATKAEDYKKKQNVFRLQTADQAEYLFQTSDSKELHNWIDTINFVCARFSAPPMESAVGSEKKFQKPLLPCSHTKLNWHEQLADHEERVSRLQFDLEEHRKTLPERSSKSLFVQSYNDKEGYLNYEVKRYKIYSNILRTRVASYSNLDEHIIDSSFGKLEEATGITSMVQPQHSKKTLSISDQASSLPNRYSYRQAIYSRSINKLQEDAIV